jgi:choline-glycine betaine transporter
LESRAGTKVVWAVVVVITVALFAITFVPLLQTVLATDAVPFWDGLLVIAIGVVLFAIVETEKQIRRHLRAINTRGPEPLKTKD